MSAAEYEQLPPKNNWMPAVKNSTSSILVGNDEPLVPLACFAVGVVHALKVYGQYGQLTKCYEMGCKVINYGLVIIGLSLRIRSLVGSAYIG